MKDLNNAPWWVELPLACIGSAGLTVVIVGAIVGGTLIFCAPAILLANLYPEIGHGVSGFVLFVVTVPPWVGFLMLVGHLFDRWKK